MTEDGEVIDTEILMIEGMIGDYWTLYKMVQKGAPDELQKEYSLLKEVTTHLNMTLLKRGVNSFGPKQETVVTEDGKHTPPSAQKTHPHNARSNVPHKGTHYPSSDKQQKFLSNLIDNANKNNMSKDDLVQKFLDEHQYKSLHEISSKEASELIDLIKGV